jgi:hypothetical protein
VVGEFFSERGDFTHRLKEIDAMSGVSYDHSGGIVSAVFKPFESVEKDLIGVFSASGIGEDSAHERMRKK